MEKVVRHRWYRKREREVELESETNRDEKDKEREWSITAADLWPEQRIGKEYISQLHVYVIIK